MELKKSLGQHFLHDENMLRKIADLMGDLQAYKTVIEIGPGHGALTKYLLKKKLNNFFAIEVDRRCVAHLAIALPDLKVVNIDFLKADLASMIEAPACIVGNFPYNISSQIIFTVIEHRDKIDALVGMFQKEVALRIAAKPSTKAYGVLSILTQAYFDCTYLLDVPPSCFTPPPKVMSGITRISKRSEPLGCDDSVFRKLVKQAFTQRRKVLSNSLKSLVTLEQLGDFQKLRPEQLSVADFVILTNRVANA